MSTAKSRQSLDALSKLRIERSEPRRSGIARWLVRGLMLLVLLALVVAAVFVLAVRNGWMAKLPVSMAVPEIMQTRLEVRLAMVSVETGQSADATVVASGYIESRRQAKIGARAPGRIEVIHVEEGSPVKEDQILAVLEHADLEASLNATRAMLERAKAELLEQDVEIARTKRAFERAGRTRGSVSEAEYDIARFQHEAAVARRKSVVAAVALAEARVREAEQMKENMFIRAPFDGTVILKDAEVGESILPGGMGEASGRGSAVTIADLEHLEVECDVKEDYISRVFRDQNAEVRIDAVPDKRYRGRVRKIIPMGDRARATIKVKVEIVDADERLFPDMSGTVYFLPPDSAKSTAHDQRRVFCDSKAVITDDEGTFVWLLGADNRVARQSVTVGSERDGRSEIIQGLTGDERAVIAPPDISAGQLVKIVE